MIMRDYIMQNIVDTDILDLLILDSQTGYWPDVESFIDECGGLQLFSLSPKQRQWADKIKDDLERAEAEY